MYCRFPLSLERLPRTHCGCLSLRTGAAISALVAIVYSVLGLSQWLAEVTLRTPHGQGAVEQWVWLATYGVIMATSFLFSALMLIGVLRDAVCLIRPWLMFTSLQLVAGVLLLLAGGASMVAAPAGDVTTTLLLLAHQFLLILIRFYMVLVVASYSSELQQQSEETERLSRLHKGSWYTHV